MTSEEDRILRYVAAYLRATGGVSPTVREIAEGTKLRASPSSMKKLIDGLIARGLMAHKPRSARSYVAARQVYFTFDEKEKKLSAAKRMI